MVADDRLKGSDARDDHLIAALIAIGAVGIDATEGHLEIRLGDVAVDPDGRAHGRDAAEGQHGFVSAVVRDAAHAPEGLEADLGDHAVVVHGIVHSAGGDDGDVIVRRAGGVQAIEHAGQEIAAGRGASPVVHHDRHALAAQIPLRQRL